MGVCGYVYWVVVRSDLCLLFVVAWRLFNSVVHWFVVYCVYGIFVDFVCTLVWVLVIL